MNGKISRRSFIKAGAGLAGMAGTGSAFFIPELLSGEFDTVRIGYLPIVDAAPLLIAYEKKFFQEEGLKAERPRMIRSWSTLSESFMSGKFNLTHLLFPIPLWMRYQNGVPLKVLAWDHTNGSAITVRADSGINHFADFGKKQIAVPYWYSLHNMILQMGLRRAGLEAVIQPQRIRLKPNQVNLLVLPPSQMAPALMGRKIDGYIVAEPFNALAEIKIKAKVMRFVGDIWKNHPCCVVVMKENVVKHKPVLTGKVVNAVARAQLWISHNRGEAAGLLSRDQSRLLPQSETVVDRAMNAYDADKYGKGTVPQAIRHPDWMIHRVDFQPYPFPSATNMILNEMRRTRVEGNSNFLKSLDSKFVQQDLIEDRFVKEAVNNLGGIGKFQEIDLTSPWKREEIIDFDI
ncbi:MAG: ABC transporter substrate-binding protein [Proteobacteria bacterium]|nr:ABC transporter substrate-binding protein [Pseudomonadota bacterium]